MIKNYTTKVPVNKTIMEIEYLLSKYGATDILKKYENGQVIAIMFRVQIKGQYFPYKLPLEEAKISEIFRKAVEKGEIPKKFIKDKEQSRRTGFRIIKDWIDSQMSLVEINLVELEEVLLPYMYDEKQDKTVYELFKEKGFDKLLGYKND